VADVDDQDGTQARVAEELRIEGGGVEAEHRARHEADGAHGEEEVARLEDGVEPCRLVAALRVGERLLQLGARRERPVDLLVEVEVGGEDGDGGGSCCLGPVVVVHVGNEALFALGRAHVDQPEGCTFADVGAQRASSQMSASSSSLTGWSLKVLAVRASVNKVARPAASSGTRVVGSAVVVMVLFLSGTSRSWHT